MPMTDETDHSGGVILDGPFDPDAQATVTDFIDYTEYLPADLMRSLTLIRNLDERYLDSAQAVHNLTRTYGQLPNLSSDERPSAIAIRAQISQQLDRAINARESSYSEASRIYDVVDRHFDRLTNIRQKLVTLPDPPSKEPTPPPPDPTKKRSGKKDSAATPRLTLTLDKKKPGSRRSDPAAAARLSGFNPDSPIASTEQSDAEGEATVAKLAKSSKRSKKDAARRPRPNPAAGFSTRDALALLKPPPDDAQVGDVDLPWIRLTEWEMTKLRKKMKKNAIWQPSEVMIQRELSLSGRGWEAYRAAKTLAEENGTDFIDCDNIEETQRGKAAKELDQTKLSNRGMKLNEAKKLKREALAREAAAEAVAEAVANGEMPAKPMISPVQGVSIARPSRKRKADDVAIEKIEEPVLVPEPARPSSKGAKRRKSSRGTGTEVAADVPEAPIATIGTEPSGTDSKVVPNLPSPTGSRRSTRSIVPPIPASTNTPPVTRPSSRRSAAGIPTELGGSGGMAPAAIPSGRELRVKSATPASTIAVREASRAPSASVQNRRRKRPAPGPVLSGQDGGASVSYGRRKAKPGKKRLNVRSSQDVRVDEDGVLEQIDANEPRYCLCGDVSFGTMICCENPDCDREWFHLDCIGLTAVPSRTAKWYCPECRIKLHTGTDGIVNGGSRR
ncbi:Zinc finger PHD-type [Penicillium taxi]|uniref:Zinc finger PHD-type n=1 Tax=Penicillium taxi TaxID=168475 RepID=UPI0025451595|nr:Zinc finger PHD-type [Penicillium taxi]KAJ5887860.1 Zinc finger PHD-type [Penicillium taxi]